MHPEGTEPTGFAAPGITDEYALNEPMGSVEQCGGGPQLPNGSYSEDDEIIQVVRSQWV